DVGLDGAEHGAGLRVARHVGYRRSIEADALIFRRQDRAHAGRSRLLHTALATLTRRDRVVVVQDPAAAITDAEGARSGYLLEVAGLAQVGEDRPLVAAGPLFRRARELRERDHRHAQLARQDLQAAAHLADLLHAVGAHVVRAHQLDVVEDDQRQAAVAVRL